MSMGGNAEKPDKKIAEAREKKEQQALLKAKDKRADEDHSFHSRSGGNNGDGGYGSQANGRHSGDDDDESLGWSTLAHAELLKRFEKLNHDHLEFIQRHEGCQELSDKLSQPKNDYGREKDLVDKLREMEKERDEWRQTSSEHVKKIKKLKIIDSYQLPLDELMKIVPDVPETPIEAVVEADKQAGKPIRTN
ncbi:hypothetical protein Tco_1547587 [Tanacetum coccineum]